jgi:hypothetical protein
VGIVTATGSTVRGSKVCSVEGRNSSEGIVPVTG